MTKQNINTNINQDYKYGFITDIENIRAPKGLSEQSIKFISDIKWDFEEQDKINKQGNGQLIKTFYI